jgi:hypothetical protein
MRLPLAAGLFALAACATAPADGAPSGETRPLTQVDAVSIRMAGPNTAVVTVRGIAPTPGYSHFTLKPFNYVQAPPDGIYDFNAVAQPPSGVVAMHTVPVEFTYRWTIGDRERAIRVHANASAVEARLPGK